MVESLKELEELCRKKDGLYSYTDGRDRKPVPKFFYHRFLDKISLLPTWLFLHTKITPNQVTVLSMVLGVVAAFFYSSSAMAAWVIGFFILQIIFVLDAVDGMIARYRKVANPIGKYFDIMAPNLIIPAVFTGITFYVYNLWTSPLAFLLGILGIIGFLGRAVSTADKNFLIYQFSATKNDYAIIDAMRGKPKQNVINGKITWRYNLHKILTFQGASFVFLLAAIIDNYTTPVVIQGFPINFRALCLILFGIILPLGFIRNMYYISKLQKKIIKYL